MRGAREIRKLIYETKTALTDEEVFTSDGYKQILSNIAASITRRYKYPVVLSIVWDDTEAGITAKTDGNLVTLNAGSHFFKGCDRVSRHKGIIGFLSHELGHCMWTDFTAMKVAFKHMLEKGWYPYRPTVEKGLDLIAIDKIDEAFKDRPALYKVYQSVMGKILNRLEDSYVNYLMCRSFPGSCRSGVEFVYTMMFQNQGTVEDSMKHGLKKFEIFFNLLLSYIVLGSVKQGSTEPAALLLEQEMLEKLNDLCLMINQARYSSDIKERIVFSNHIFIKMWDWLKDFIAEDERDSSAGDSSDGGVEESTEDSSSEGADKSTKDSLDKCAGKSYEHSDDTMEDLLNQKIKSLESCGGSVETEIPKSATKPVPLTEAEKEALDSIKSKYKNEESVPRISTSDRILSEEPTPTEGHGTSTWKSQSDITDESMLEKVMDEIASEKADAVLEGELSDELNEALKTVNFPALHRDKNFVIKRIDRVPPELRIQYQSVRLEIERLSKRMQKNVLDMMRLKKNGAKFTSLLMGRHIMTNALFRTDGRIFYEQKLPERANDMAVALLVDMSKSMSRGNRILFAQKAALLLHHFCLSLDIPILVMGHSEEFEGNKAVELYAYADFDKPDWNDQFRMMDIRPMENNRDGAALKFVGHKLMQRPETDKLLFVLSDGEPAASDYGGIYAQLDLQLIKKDIDRARIILFAGAIGDDKESIHNCYGDSFLDLSDLSSLPVRIVSQLKKHIFI